MVDNNFTDNVVISRYPYYIHMITVETPANSTLEVIVPIIVADRATDSTSDWVNQLGHVHLAFVTLLSVNIVTANNDFGIRNMNAWMSIVNLIGGLYLLKNIRDYVTDQSEENRIKFVVEEIKTAQHDCPDRLVIINKVDTQVLYGFCADKALFDVRCNEILLQIFSQYEQSHTLLYQDSKVPDIIIDLPCCTLTGGHDAVDISLKEGC